MASEKEAKQKEPKIGVYVCYCGGNISDHVDVEEVAKEAEKLPNVSVARANMFMCSDPGQELIVKDIEDGKVDRVVVASCAPALHESTFRGAINRTGLNPYLYEHANIREQVSWVHHGETATKKACALVSAAAAKAGRLDPLDAVRVDARKHATVIGGGVAGMRASLDLARKGLKVALVEATPFLGGFVSRLSRLAPTGEPASDLVAKLAALVLEHANITVYTCAQITGFSGYIGNFNLSLTLSPPQQEQARNLKHFRESGLPAGSFLPFAGVLPHKPPAGEQGLDIETGALIMATGLHNYIPSRGEYAFGESPMVMTLPHFIQEMESIPERGGALSLNGRKVRRVAMIHCVGSRQIPGVHEPPEDGNLNEHCSRVCCTSILFWAGQVRERYPETAVLDFYRDIRTFGRGHEEVYREAGEKGVLFFRFEADAPPLVTPTGPDGQLKIQVKDVLTFGEEIEVGVDLVVLATGVCPGGGRALAEMMKVPQGADRFLQEVHPKLQPVEVANAGVYLAGTCQAPMDAGESVEAAQAAAAKASVLLSRGHVDLAPYVARVDEARCTGSGECVAACPVEGAIKLMDISCGGEPSRRAEVNPALCNGCGICVAACPSRALDVAGWTLDQYEAMVDAIAACA